MLCGVGWVGGWGDVITFLEVGSMVAATQDVGLGGVEQSTFPGYGRSMGCCMRHAHIGKMNLSRPSAATMDTCKYIHAPLMGCGAS